MKPTWETNDGAIRLYCADCLDVLPTLEAGSVDAVVTDPPYGIGWKAGTWDDDPAKYPALMAFLVSEANRLVANGWCFVFQAMPNVGRFHEWFPPDFRLFASCKNFAQIRPNGVWHSWDPVVFWKCGTPPPSDRGDCTARDYFVGNAAGIFGEKSEHPSPKLIDTMEHIVQIATPHPAIVCDPFMGSGTTGVACVRLGRQFIGIEREPRYFAMAVNRIESELNRFPLLEPKQPTQGSLLP